MLTFARIYRSVIFGQTQNRRYKNIVLNLRRGLRWIPSLIEPTTRGERLRMPFLLYYQPTLSHLRRQTIIFYFAPTRHVRPNDCALIQYHILYDNDCSFIVVPRDVRNSRHHYSTNVFLFCFSRPFAVVSEV